MYGLCKRSNAAVDAAAVQCGSTYFNSDCAVIVTTLALSRALIGRNGRKALAGLFLGLSTALAGRVRGAALSVGRLRASTALCSTTASESQNSQ